MKTCTKCGTQYPATAEFFVRDTSRSSGLHPWCKACSSQSQRQWELDHRAHVRERQRHRYWNCVDAERERSKRALPRKRETNFSLREKNQVWLTDLRTSLLCEECGSKDDLCFHHRDPLTKKFNLGRPTTRSTETIQAEVEKCAIMCRSCHTTHHAQARRRGNG